MGYLIRISERPFGVLVGLCALILVTSLLFIGGRLVHASTGQARVVDIPWSKVVWKPAVGWTLYTGQYSAENDWSSADAQNQFFYNGAWPEMYNGLYDDNIAGVWTTQKINHGGSLAYEVYNGDWVFTSPSLGRTGSLYWGGEVYDLNLTWWSVLGGSDNTSELGWSLCDPSGIYGCYAHPSVQFSNWTNWQ